MKPIFLFLNFERALFFNLKTSILSISRDEFFKLSGLLRVPKIWSKVVFPAPEGPTIVVI